MIAVFSNKLYVVFNTIEEVCLIEISWIDLVYSFLIKTFKFS